MYLAMLGNTGVINCYGAPPFERKGARPVGAPDYHGEVWLTGHDGGAPQTPGNGTARIAEWSPNRVVVDVEGADPGSLLVYNMNFDEGWRSDAGPVVSQQNVVAARLPGGSARVTLRYRPPYLGIGVLSAALAVGALVWLRRRERAEG
jgi:hypothetical protein